MKIKLSDYILEQSISDASINDIEFERSVAELAVTTAIAECYVKNYHMGLFQEVTAQQPPPDYSEFRDVESQEALQKRWQDRLRELGAEFKSEEQDTSLSPYIQKYGSYFPDDTIIGAYTDGDGTPFIVAVDNELISFNEADDPGRNRATVHLIRFDKSNGQFYNKEDAQIYLKNVNMSDVTRDNLSRAVKHWSDAADAANAYGRKADKGTFNKNFNAAIRIEDREIGAKKYRDAEREDMKAADKSYSPNADPNGIVGMHMKNSAAASLIWSLLWVMSVLIGTLLRMLMLRREWGGKYVKGLNKTLKSINIYLNDALSRVINDPSSFDETNFSQMVSTYNTALNQAIQFLKEGSDEIDSNDAKGVLDKADNAAAKSGLNSLDATLRSKLLFDNDTLIKSIMRNRGMIETKFSQLPPDAIASIIESTERYQQVIVPSIKQIQEELKRIQSDPTTMKPATTPAATSPAQPTQQNPTSTPAPQTQPPQQKKKPGELDAGNGMMMMQPPQG